MNLNPGNPHWVSGFFYCETVVPANWHVLRLSKWFKSGTRMYLVWTPHERVHRAEEIRKANQVKNHPAPAAENSRIKSNSRDTHKRQIALLWIICAAAPLAAQTQDTGTLYSGIAFSVAGIVIMVMLLMLFRRLGNRRKSDMEDSGLNLMSMKQKNLLTPEEMRMVSAAIARRMAEKETRKTSNTPLTTATLLHDPEVLRLQQEALAKRDREKNQPADPPTDTTNDDDVELPPEVQQLADAGILTEEEIANVKRRLRNRT